MGEMRWQEVDLGGGASIASLGIADSLFGTLWQNAHLRVMQCKICRRAVFQCETSRTW